MADLSKITFKTEEKKELLSDIQAFFQEERGETIGLIAAEKVLDFFIDIMGAHVYNKALDETQMWFKRYMDNIEADFFSLYKHL
ncbi:MAG: DUF2164 domain-containing protein [Lachnospiraceae bacterium]|nr:DUF2164 domain-containing protein [Lachnospiraceae bacterium]